MPRYDYECESCHHRFELRQSFDSEPVAACPECQNRSTRKFHSVPIVFKGSGWYVNDYGKRGCAKDASADGKDSDSSSKSEVKTKSESKDSSSAGSGKSESKTSASSEAKSTSKGSSE